MAASSLLEPHFLSFKVSTTLFSMLLCLNMYTNYVQAGTSQLKELFVDPVNGNDSVCFSNTSLSQPCKTIKKALGNVDCNCRNITEDTVDSLENTVLKLMDGVHVIDDCVGIKFGTNISIEAVNTGNAIIKCGRFPSSRRFETGLVSCNTNGLTFSGVSFELCGPYTPNVFINRSRDVLFEDCMFRCVVSTCMFMLVNLFIV